MPAAIILAMQLKEPQRLLFESIGFLQDSAFVAGEMHLDVSANVEMKVSSPKSIITKWCLMRR